MKCSFLALNFINQDKFTYITSTRASECMSNQFNLPVISVKHEKNTKIKIHFFKFS